MVPARDPFERHAFSKLLDRYPGGCFEKLQNFRPGHKICFVFCTLTPELDREIAAAAGVFDEPGDVVHLMHPVLVFMEVAGKVEPLPVQGFALDR